VTQAAPLARRVSDDERRRRWRLALGRADDTPGGAALAGDDLRIDATLAALYDSPPAGSSSGKRRGGLGASSPSVARWLGDVRRYFPSSVVQVMQRDAIDRLGLERLLLEPEMLAAVEPDIHVVGTLLALRHLLPDTTTATARQVVATVTRQLEERLTRPLHDAVRGALRRDARTRRPRQGDIDWNRTILANLRHWSPEHRTLVPERLVGYGRRGPALGKEVVLAVDQSGSMADSVVHAAVLASALASLRAVHTSLVVFDTEIADLTGLLDDPVEVLFGVQLGGGTDINRAVAYCQQLVRRPAETVLVLVTDLYEGGVRDEMLARLAALARSGVVVVVLLALSDDGAPSYDHDNAARLAEVGVPALACTPDAFPELLAAALERRDLELWASDRGVALSAPLRAWPSLLG